MKPRKEVCSAERRSSEESSLQFLLQKYEAQIPLTAGRSVLVAPAKWRSLSMSSTLLITVKSSQLTITSRCMSQFHTDVTSSQTYFVNPFTPGIKMESVSGNVNRDLCPPEQNLCLRWRLRLPLKVWGFCGMFCVLFASSKVVQRTKECRTRGGPLFLLRLAAKCPLSWNTVWFCHGMTFADFSTGTYFDLARWRWRKTSRGHAGPPKAVPSLTVTSGQILFSWEHCFLLITDLCSLNLIGSPWSCGTLAVNTFSCLL